MEQALQKKALVYDKSGEEHYNLISALHKSLRGSDPDAALYWLARMLAAGEDPLYVARRLIRFASEDIGNADPQALQLLQENFAPGGAITLTPWEPAEVWPLYAANVVGAAAMPSGHYLNDEAPAETAAALRAFFSSPPR